MSEELAGMGIPDIIGDLEEATKKKSGGFSDVKVVNMKNWEYHGRTYIAPINGPTKADAAIKQLNSLMVVEQWVSGKKKDGSDYGFVDKMYFSLDTKLYGELTEEQIQRHERIKSKLSAVPKTCQGVYRATITLIQGHVIQHTSHATPSKVLIERSPAVYVFQSKNFEKELTGQIQGMVAKMKNYDWYHALCSRTVQKSRYMDINHYLNKGDGGGYQVSISFSKFDEDAVNLTDGKIGLDLTDKGGEEYLSKFGNPVKTWLGIPQENSLFDNDYLAEIESILNKVIKGEETTKVVNYNEGGEATKPNSNASFKDLDTAIQTQVNTEVQGTAEGDSAF